MRIAVTHFAPAERVPIEVVHRQAAAFQEAPLASAVLNSVLNCVFVLNAQRQIVMASRNVLELTPGQSLENIMGQRPGEALGCLHAWDCENGCGTGEGCAECGAAQAILASLAGQRDLRECRMTRVIRCEEQALDLLVLATPLVHNQENYCLLSIADISHEKRRRVLEKVFFHDVINLAGGVDGMLASLTASAPPSLRGDLVVPRAALHELLEEVQTQRDLAAAESAALPVAPVRVDSRELLLAAVRVYQSHPAAEGRHIRLAAGLAGVEFTTDPLLLQRVLGSLIKNALEACAPGQTVTVGCEEAGEKLRFTVHNPTFMPRAVQLQVFHRSFTTKGPGRGLGTYSAKLLTEKYLRGQVRFTSTPEEGTTFAITLDR